MLSDALSLRRSTNNTKTVANKRKDAVQTTRVKGGIENASESPNDCVMPDAFPPTVTFFSPDGQTTATYDRRELAVLKPRKI